MIGMGRGAGEARVDDDQRRVVALLAAEDVLQRDGVGLRRIAAHDEDGLGVVDVVVGVGHGAVAPGVGDAGHGGGMTDARLVVHVVGAPEGGQLAEQVGLLIAVLGGAQPVDRVRAGLLADGEHLVPNLIEGLVPGDALPLAADQFHRVLEPALAMAVLAHRRALGAVRAEVEGVIEGRLLTRPDAVAHLGVDAAAHGAVGADGPCGLHRIHRRGGRIGRAHLAHHAGREGRPPVPRRLSSGWCCAEMRGGSPPARSRVPECQCQSWCQCRRRGGYPHRMEEVFTSFMGFS